MPEPEPVDHVTAQAETQPAPTAEEVAARRLARHTWYGYLAGDTIDQIEQRIRKLIGDGQRYTWVSYNTTQPHTFPDVRTGQRVEPGKATDRQAIKVSKDDGFVHLTVVDTYGVWGMYSTHATEADARKAAEDEKDWSVTYVAVEGWGQGGRDRIEISQYNGYGEVLHWVISPEYLNRDETAEAEAAVLDRAAALVEGTDPAEVTTRGEAADVLRDAAKRTRHTWESQLPELGSGT